MKKRIVASLFVVVLLGCLAGCITGECSDRILSEQRSPDEVLVATVFVRDCGATTDFTTVLTVNVPGKYDKAESVMFAAKGERKVLVSWTGRRSIHVDCRDCVDSSILNQVLIAGGVHVSYSVPTQVSAPR